MSSRAHQACYGKMMPDFGRLKFNEWMEGKAFRVLVEKIGIGTRRRQREFKAETWDAFLECPEFRSCYDLAMAQLALHAALEKY